MKSLLTQLTNTYTTFPLSSQYLICISFPTLSDAIGYASVFSLTTAALPDFGQARLGTRSNLYLTLFMLSASIGSYLGGEMRSLFGSYKWVFVMNLVISVVVFICSVAFKLQMDRRKEQGNRSSESVVK